MEEELPDDRTPLPVEADRVADVEARDTLEERVDAPERTEELPEAFVARDTLLREAEALREKLLWEAAPRAEKLPSR